MASRMLKQQRSEKVVYIPEMVMKEEFSQEEEEYPCMEECDPLYIAPESDEGTRVKSEVQERLNHEGVVPEVSGVTPNTATRRKGSRIRLTSQARMMIMSVYKQFRKQNEKESETDVEIRTASATGISVSSLQRIKHQSKRGPIRSPPSRARIAPVLGIVNDLDKDHIRREILSFYERSEIPTIDVLLERVKEKPVSFLGSNSSLRKLVKQLGFKFRKTENSKFMLVERDDVVVARNKYLRIIDENRRAINPKPEIYIGETWMNENECVGKCSVGSKQKTGKGGWIMIVHAGCENGFVPGAFLLCLSCNGIKGDRQYGISHTFFQSWFETQLLPNIPSHCLIMMDNAYYHSEFLDKPPTCHFTKCEIIHWLTKHNIFHDSSHTKSELLLLVKAHKHKQVYVIDEIARNAGHEVVRLPHYHSRLNPLELIWAQVKGEVKKNNLNGSQTLSEIQEMAKDAVGRVTAEEWKNCVQDVRQIEDEYRKKDRAFDHLMENFFSNIADECSDSDSDIAMDEVM